MFTIGPVTHRPHSETPDARTAIQAIIATAGTDQAVFMSERDHYSRSGWRHMLRRRGYRLSIRTTAKVYENEKRVPLRSIQIQAIKMRRRMPSPSEFPAEDVTIMRSIIATHRTKRPVRVDNHYRLRKTLLDLGWKTSWVRTSSSGWEWDVRVVPFLKDRSR